MNNTSTQTCRHIKNTHIIDVEINRETEECGRYVKVMRGRRDEETDGHKYKEIFKKKVPFLSWLIILLPVRGGMEEDDWRREVVKRKAGNQ